MSSNSRVNYTTLKQVLEEPMNFSKELTGFSVVIPRQVPKSVTPHQFGSFPLWIFQNCHLLPFTIRSMMKTFGIYPSKQLTRYDAL